MSNNLMSLLISNQPPGSKYYNDPSCNTIVYLTTDRLVGAEFKTLNVGDEVTVNTGITHGKPMQCTLRSKFLFNKEVK